jgi:hypothetical protein
MTRINAGRKSQVPDASGKILIVHIS